MIYRFIKMYNCKNIWNKWKFLLKIIISASLFFLINPVAARQQYAMQDNHEPNAMWYPIVIQKSTGLVLRLIESWPYLLISGTLPEYSGPVCRSQAAWELPGLFWFLPFACPLLRRDRVRSWSGWSPKTSGDSTYPPRPKPSGNFSRPTTAETPSPLEWSD